MKNPMLIAACLLTGAVMFASGAWAQTSNPSPAAPATSSGSIPNLAGVWIVTNYRGPLADMSPELAATKAGPPFTPAGLEKYQKAVEDKKILDTGPSSRCLPPSISFLMVMPYAMEIVQTPQRVFTFHEFGNYVRKIWMDGRGHGDPDPSWLGHSIGRYEGDTLVVDSVGFNGKTWLDQMGLRNSDALHTIERFRRVGADLEYKITLDDPKAFTRPWTAEAKFRPTPPSFTIPEFVCMENNEYVGSPGMKLDVFQ